MNAKKTEPKVYISQPAAAAGIVALTPWHRHPPRTLFASAPTLRSIWRDELADIAEMHTRQWETDPDESGKILVASLGGGGDSRDYRLVSHVRV